jgi:outer membrane protein OmpA-like peptidoglycan-associated protein
MFLRVSKITRLALTVACASVMPIAIAAQESAQPPAAPTPAPKAASTNYPSKYDLFAGFSYLAPKGSIIDNGTQQDSAKSVTCCAVFSVARYFTNNVGVQVEGDFHKNGSNNVAVVHNQFAGGSGGLIFRIPTEDITPFVHALIGGEAVSTTYYPSTKWGIVLTAGGGIDYNTPWLDHRLAIRVFQADYQYTHENMYPVARLNLNMARLSTGLVVSIGTMAPPPTVTLACVAEPNAVFPGEPVTITGTAANLLPKNHVIYGWSGQGVTGTDTVAKLDTSNLAPGTYTVNGTVKEGKPGKEGLKPWESGSCTATVTVKEFEPPTLSCSANPTDLKPGDSSTITAQGVSPQNRPLTYSYQASGGTISGSGTTATYSSTGASSGPVQITGTVTDDKGHTATCSTSVNVQAPPPPPPPQPSPELIARLTLHSVWFATAQPTVKHPEGGLVESQQTALTALATDFKNYLQLKPDGRLTLTGHADPRGTPEFNQKLSERRVARVKAFLVEQGVPEANLDTQAVGEEHQLSKDEVKNLIETNSDLTDEQKKRVLSRLNVIVLAQNRRVDIRLNGTNQESNLHYPFNAADSATLLDLKKPIHKAAPKKK